MKHIQRTMRIFLAGILCLSIGKAWANEQVLLPSTMPETYLDYRIVDTENTNGVTFVLTDIHYEENDLQINVLQLPNDEDTALVDNQVDYGSNTTELERTVKKARTYGKRLLGTICDLSGKLPFKEYSVDIERIEAGLSMCFTIYDLPQNTDVFIDFVFGVNEDLNSHFDYYEHWQTTVQAP